MVHYKIMYFPTRGNAEVARMILGYAGIEFEDVRPTLDEFREKYKSDMPFGQLPALFEDDKILAQSFSINRYLAQKYGLAGKDDFEQAQIDSLADFFKDFFNEVNPYFLVMVGFKEGDKETLYKDLFFPATEKYLPTLKKYLRDSTCGFYFNSGPTWVDFYISEWLDTFNNYNPGFYQKHQELKEHSEKVKSLAQLEKYLKNRPVTKV